MRGHPELEIELEERPRLPHHQEVEVRVGAQAAPARADLDVRREPELQAGGGDREIALQVEIDELVRMPRGPEPRRLAQPGRDERPERRVEAAERERELVVLAPPEHQRRAARQAHALEEQRLGQRQRHAHELVAVVVDGFQPGAHAQDVVLGQRREAQLRGAVQRELDSSRARPAARRGSGRRACRSRRAIRSRPAGPPPGAPAPPGRTGRSSAARTGSCSSGRCGEERRVERARRRPEHRVAQRVHVHGAVQRQEAADRRQLQAERQRVRRREADGDEEQERIRPVAAQLDHAERGQLEAVGEAQRQPAAPGDAPVRRLDALQEPAAGNRGRVQRHGHAVGQLDVDRIVDGLAVLANRDAPHQADARERQARRLDAERQRAAHGHRHPHADLRVAEERDRGGGDLDAPLVQRDRAQLLVERGDDFGGPLRRRGGRLPRRAAARPRRAPARRCRRNATRRRATR